MEAGTKPPEQVDGEQQTEEKPDEKQVPYDRFKEVNEQRKELEDKLSELQNKIIEFEDRDKSEVDRERAARERAEQTLQQLTGEVTNLKKGSWVRSAAAELNFHDPEDAVAHLHDDLAQFEDARSAKKAVERLAKQKEHLIRQEDKKPPRPAIGRVLEQGQQTQQTQQPQSLTPMQQQAESERQFAEGLAAELRRVKERSGDWMESGGIT